MPDLGVRYVMKFTRKTSKVLENRFMFLFQGFKRKEFRGKLAIAITVNFINRHSEAESHVEEISGVAFIFNQKFFNDLNEAKGILLENIVYYKVRQSIHHAVQARISILTEKLLLFLQHDDAQKD